MRSASPERWAEAQAAERSFWEPSAYSLEVFSGTLASVAESAAWMQRNAPDGLPGSDRVELGIGPLGVGCIHFLPRPDDAKLVGVDPIERTPTSVWPLPEPLASIVMACQATCAHEVAQAESTGLEGGRFGVAVLHNMLDHVQDPAAVLAEAHRLLRPGGLILLTCDTISLANRIRLRLYAQRRFANSLFIRAHPFHFRVREVIRLIREAGFQLRATNRRRPTLLYETAGHSHRLLVLAEKP